MMRIPYNSIDLRGRPLEVGSVIRLNGSLCVVTGYDAESEHDGKPIEYLKITDLRIMAKRVGML